MLDVRAFLDDDFESAIARDAASDGEVSVSLAGTGVGMARALAPHADAVYLIGAIGSDPASDLLARLLEVEPFERRVVRKDGSAGVAVVLRDNDEAAVHGHRLVAAARGSNDQATISDVAAVNELIATADVLVVDAYGLLADPRRAATRHAMAVAREANRHVFLDLVPHDLFRHWTLSQCRALISDATIVATSGATLAHLLGIPWEGMQPLDAPTSRKVAREATLALGRRTYLVHYGPGHCGETLAYDGAVLWIDHTDYPAARPDQLSGFGDRLNARELARLLAIDDPGRAA